MSRTDSRVRERAWKWARRLGQGLGVLALGSAGSFGGWSLARWQDASLAPEQALEVVEGIVTYRLTLALAEPPLLLAERMPEDGAVEPAALGTLEPRVSSDSGAETSDLAAEPDPLPTDGDPLLMADGGSDAESVDLPPATDPDDLAATLEVLDPRDRPAPVAVVLDARDRAVLPPSAAVPEPAARQPGLEAAVTAAAPRPAPTPSTYVVEPGDTLSGVAYRFGVNVDAVRMANNLSVDSIIWAGQPLLVPSVVYPTPSPGVVTVVSAPSQGAAQASAARPAATPTKPVPTPTKPVPTPTKPAAGPTARPTQVVAAAPTPRPTSVPAAAAASRAAPSGVPGGPLAWPLSGTLTQRFGASHSGLDLAAPLGTPLRAAAAGTVIVAAKADYGYGWRIVVDHGGGYTTLYAHMSAFSVAEGARVARGQVIGAVGSTGLSTGPHVHFEVLSGGRAVDPLQHLP